MPRQQQVTVLPVAIRQWRKERGFSQSDLARKAKCSEGLIAQIETGRRQPGYVNAVAIANAFGIPLEAFAISHVDVTSISPDEAA